MEHKGDGWSKLRLSALVDLQTQPLEGIFPPSHLKLSVQFQFLRTRQPLCLKLHINYQSRAHASYSFSSPLSTLSSSPNPHLPRDRRHPSLRLPLPPLHSHAGSGAPGCGRRGGAGDSRRPSLPSSPPPRVVAPLLTGSRRSGELTTRRARGTAASTASPGTRRSKSRSREWAEAEEVHGGGSIRGRRRPCPWRRGGSTADGSKAASSASSRALVHQRSEGRQPAAHLLPSLLSPSAPSFRAKGW
jgi:hypothetical protein